MHYGQRERGKKKGRRKFHEGGQSILISQFENSIHQFFGIRALFFLETKHGRRTQFLNFLVL